jgi:hypothetical protein
MAWIKRNLYFSIAGVIAVVLMGLAGWYLYSEWDRNDQILKDLDAEYGELSNLNAQNPHPGSGKVDNIKIAQAQRQELLAYIKKTRGFFQPISPVPNSPRLTDHEFSEALTRAIAEMQHEAGSATVTLPPAYCFSFEAQNKQFNFSPGNLPSLAKQLGEVKALCEVLFRAKINSLEGIRREVISTNDTSGPLTDYVEQKSLTNDLAVISPYEVTFRCFSTELASALAGYAVSPNCFVVKSISVEAAPAEAANVAQPGTPVFTQPVQVQQFQPPPPPTRSAADDEFNRRYGGPSRRTPTPPTQYAPPPAAAPAAPASHGLPTVLDEKLLKVTLGINVVKPLPAK